jgi:hypothetical protein
VADLLADAILQTFRRNGDSQGAYLINGSDFNP